MIGKFGNKPELIDTQITAVLNRMSDLGLENTEEYSKLLVYLERLNETKAKNRPSRVSGDTIAIVLGNLLGILIIVMYEQKHVLSTKAFGFGMKKPVAP